MQDKRQLLRRVNDELDAGNPAWQVVVNRRDWLCPFCGEVGAARLRMEESLEIRIVQHLATCPAYGDGSAEPLDAHSLKRRAAVLALKKQVRRSLKRDPAWQLETQDERWICPFCARPTDHRPAQADLAAAAAADSEDGEPGADGSPRAKSRRLDRHVIGVLKHLNRCPGWDEERRAKGSLGPTQPLEVLAEARDKHNRGRRAERVRERLKRDPGWRHRDMDKQWVCPFCARSTDIPFPKEQEPSAELAERVARHLDRCASHQRLNGEPRAERYLKDRVIAINRLLILEKLRRKLSTHAIWQVTDADDEWYCPYCAQATSVKLPEAERDEVSEATLNAVWGHLAGCSEYAGKKAELKARSVLLTAVAEVDRGKRQKRELRRALLEDPRFAVHDAFGSWLCPYCRKVQKRISASTERSLLERTVELVSDHLTRHCTHWVEDQPPAVRLEELLVQAEPRLRQPVAAGGGGGGSAGGGSSGAVAALGSAGGAGAGAASAFPTLPLAGGAHVGGRGEHGLAAPAAARGESGAPGAPGRGDGSQVSSRLAAVGQGGAGGVGGLGGADSGLRRRGAVELPGELEQSLEDARVRQLRLLPKLPDIPGFEFGVVYEPVARIGGDFYDFFRISEHELGVAVGDVSGHGIEAALLVGLAKKLIQIHARGRSSPGQALLLANADIYPDLDARTFVTVFLANLNTRTRRLRFARAGHNPVILFNPGRAPRLQVLDAKGMALGMDPGPIFRTSLEEVEIELRSGDLLVQYTDGVTESTNHEREEFGLERLYSVIERYGAEEAEYVLYQVERAVQDFREGARQADDVTLLAIRVA